MAETATVFEIGQKVAVYDDCEHYIEDGITRSMEERGGEEFYEVEMPNGQTLTLSEMRLADA